jgi:hypothetical protein
MFVEGRWQAPIKMSMNLFSTLLIPPPEKAVDREAALSWLTRQLPEYESLAAHLSRRLVQELEKDTPADGKLEAARFRAAALYLLQRDVQTIAWACSPVISGLPSVVIEQELEIESIEGFGGSVVSALRLLVAEAGVVDPASEAFRELRAALGRWQAKEREAAAE